MSTSSERYLGPNDHKCIAEDRYYRLREMSLHETMASCACATPAGWVATLHNWILEREDKKKYVRVCTVVERDIPEYELVSSIGRRV